MFNTCHSSLEERPSLLVMCRLMTAAVAPMLGGWAARALGQRWNSIVQSGPLVTWDGCTQAALKWSLSEGRSPAAKMLWSWNASFQGPPELQLPSWHTQSWPAEWTANLADEAPALKVMLFPWLSSPCSLANGSRTFREAICYSVRLIHSSSSPSQTLILPQHYSIILDY